MTLHPLSPTGLTALEPLAKKGVAEIPGAAEAAELVGVSPPGAERERGSNAKESAVVPGGSPPTAGAVATPSPPPKRRRSTAPVDYKALDAKLREEQQGKGK